MKHALPISFEDAVSGIEGAVVLLDVDGTLLPDGGNTIEPTVIARAQLLAQKNIVYLVSNGTDVERLNRFSMMLGIPVAPAGTPAGKPSARAAEGIERVGKNCIVMGDKQLTDGMFARAIGARFILIRPKVSGKERLSVRLSYLIERIVSFFV